MFETLLVLISITFLAMLSPGPDMILLIKNSMSGRIKSGFACVVGICASISVHLALAIGGLAAVMAASVYVYNTVRVCGAVYLIYIGYKSIRYANTNFSIPSAHQATTKATQAFLEGFLCNLLNPKFTLFLLSMFSQFITPSSNWFDKALLGGVIFFESAVLWSIFVLVLQTRVFRIFLIRSAVGINRTLGVVLIFLGLLLAFKG